MLPGPKRDLEKNKSTNMRSKFQSPFFDWGLTGLCSADFAGSEKCSGVTLKYNNNNFKVPEGLKVVIYRIQPHEFERYPDRSTSTTAVVLRYYFIYKKK